LSAKNEVSPHGNNRLLESHNALEFTMSTKLQAVHRSEINLVALPYRKAENRVPAGLESGAIWTGAIRLLVEGTAFSGGASRTAQMPEFPCIKL
jgi:hypothetical protein